MIGMRSPWRPLPAPAAAAPPPPACRAPRDPFPPFPARRPCRRLPLRGHPAAGEKGGSCRRPRREEGIELRMPPAFCIGRASSASGRRPDLPFGRMPPAFGRSPSECPAALALPLTRRDPARGSARGGLSARRPRRFFGAGRGGCCGCGGCAFYAVIPAKLSWRRPERPGRGCGRPHYLSGRCRRAGGAARRPAAPASLRHRYYKPRARPAHGIL